MTNPHENLLQAVLHLLEARRADMLTIEEWTGLARAAAACQEAQTAAYLTERDLEDIAEYEVEWNEATDGPLPE
jgi:predicted mannosyl-3-phosphoglycerate phosphatase (HAD superfamily)